MAVNLVVGDDGANILTGSAGRDAIYGFDPNGPQANVTSITATRVASGLSGALFAVAPPNDTSRLFIVQKDGPIRILDLNTGQLLATPFLNLAGQVGTDGERGLLGLAFDPDFVHNGLFYVNLTNTDGDIEVRRYQVSSNPNVANPGSGTLILTIEHSSATNHNGGWIDFGPDGYLYIGTGDGGGSGDPDNNAQNINSLLGKMLRIDVRSDAFPSDPLRNYAIPTDNPYVGVAGADEIYAIGLRNPWRNSFDRALDDFYIADVGQGTYEEIDLGQLGANYGWDIFEGPLSSGGTPTGGSAVPPIHFYDRSVGASITGGYVYRGTSEGLHGQYFFGDFVTGRVFTLRFDGSAWVATERTAQITTSAGAINNPSSFGEDAAGNLYLVDFDGDIFRLTPNVVSADIGDSLFGLGGDDSLFGGSGNDLLDGGAGADLLNGGDGFDRATYASALGGVTADLRNIAFGAGDAAGDLFISIEGLIGSSFADVLIGDDAANELVGEGGDDLIGGLGGDDVIAGRDGNDILGADDGNDIVNGGAGNDTVFGGAGDDQVGGGTGDDIVVGDDGNDSVWGEDGDDLVNGGAGDDILLGGNGNDRFGGGTGNDIVQGEAGDDTIWGEEGDDLMVGGTGDDIIIGGPGNDAFVFNAGDGSDVIVDFVAGGSEDRLWFNGTNLHSFADVQANTSYDAAGNATTISYNGGAVTLNGVAPGQLNAGDFIFT